MTDISQGAPLEITIRKSNRQQQFAPDIVREGQVPGGERITDETGGNDAGADFLLQRRARDEGELLSRAREKYGVPLPGAGASSQPSPGATAEPSAAPIRPAINEDGQGGSAREPIKPAEVSAPAPGVAQGNLLEDIKGMGRFATAAGGELVRTPRAVVAGVAAAGRELFEATDSLATWLNQNVIDLTVPVPKTGSDAVDAFLANPSKAIADAIPQPETPDTVTGPIVKEVSQFLAGMVAGGKMLKAAGATLKGAKASLAAGAVSDALFFDPDEKNLAALLKGVPELDGPVTTFLATNPDDNEAVNRLRRSVEGLGLGLVTDAFIAGLRAYRAQRAAAKGEKAGADAAVQQQRERFGELKADDLAAKVGGENALDAKVVTIADQKATAAVKAADEKLTGRFVEAEQSGTLRKVDETDILGFVDETGAGRQRSLVIAPDGGVYSIDAGGHRALLDQLEPSEKQALVMLSVFDRGAGKEIGIHSLGSASKAQARVIQRLEAEAGKINRQGDATVKITKSDLTAAGITDKADDLAARAEVLAEPKPARGDLPGGRIAINWARIETGDDIKVAMRDMADHFKSEIRKARRDKMSVEDTKSLADELGMSVDDLLARREGQAFNAEEVLAARRLLTMASEKLMEAARAAADPNAGPVDLFAFRRMVATHAAIQNEVLAARAEAGRALNAWKIPAAAAGDVERSRAIAEALSAAGGDRMARELARRMQMLAEAGAPESAVAAVARKGWGAATWDAVAEVWVNGLLSSPKTHIVNVASNSLVMAQQILERGIAEKLGQLTAETGARPLGVAPGEAMAMAAGIIQAQKDAWRMMWMALKSGETGQALGKVDLPHQRAVTAEAFRIENDAAAKTVDFLGTVARVPSRLLGAEDEFFKTIGYRMELNAQAVRQATSEGLQGKELRERVAAILADPPEYIRLQATDAALYQTFTSRAGDAADALLRLREAWPATMYVLPFVRTPLNILHYGFERTPLAPLMQSFRDDIAAGGARAELAKVRMAAGTTIMLLAADYADRGLITGQGPKDAGKREVLMRQGWQPYSIRVGDRWVAYDRADPYGLLFGFAADMAEFSNRMDIDEDKLDEFSEIMAAGITAIASTTVNKTYLRGLADLVWTVEDPQRKAFGYVGSMMGSFVPAGVALGKTIDDPVLRETFTAWDYVQGRLPGLSAGMTPARDLWGRERKPMSGFGTAYDALSPLRASEIKPYAIDVEMGRLNMGIERIDKKTSVDGAPVNFRDWPEVYDRYVVLAGNALKHPAYGLGAREFLDAVVSGKHAMSAVYNRLGDGPEGGKADFIRATVRDYRKLAQQAILADPAFADFQAAWREARDAFNERNRKLQDVAPVPTPDINRPMPPGAPAVNQPPATISPMQVPR